MRSETYYVARYQPTTNGGAITGAVPVWEWQGYPLPYNPSVALGPNGTATALTSFSRSPAQSPIRDLLYTRLAGLPAVWQPTLCQSPPTAALSYTRPQPDSLVLAQASLPGAAFAQLWRWRWQVGSPGTPGYRVVQRDSSAGPPLRLAFAAGQLPPFGTPVTLTVTNSLGCAASAVVYPFGTLAASPPAPAEQPRLWPVPTPAGQPVRVQWRGRPAGTVSASVCNTLGQVVGKAQWPAAVLAAGEASLPTAGLPPGLYWLRLRAADGSGSTLRLLMQ